MTDQDLPSTGPPDPESPVSPVLDPRSESGERRRTPGLSPIGVERRSWQERRKLRSAEGRERYLDMVQRERSLLIEQGVTRSTEQLLDSAGAATHADQDEGVRDRATGDQLRSILPVQSWLPLSIHLIGLRDGVMRIAPLHELNDRQRDQLRSIALRSGFKIDRVEVEVWDRKELIDTLKAVHDLSADRCEKNFGHVA